MMLEWVKNLFKKKYKISYDITIDKRDWKKNWLGLTKVYDSYGTDYKWCFIKVTSHLTDDDDIKDRRNTLTIGLGGRYRKWLLPFSIIRPVLDYHSYKQDANFKDIEPKELLYSIYKERSYELSYASEEGFLSLNWNTISDPLYNITKHKGKEMWVWLFWKQCTRSKNELLNLDHSLYKDITNINDYDEIKEYENKQEHIYFKILDYDKEEVIVKTRIERMTYTYGGSKYTKLLMSLFKKPIVHTTLNLEFLSEIGPKKGSWKGGTVGHSVEILPGEYYVDAFKRYCLSPELKHSRDGLSNNLTYVAHSSFLTDGHFIMDKYINPFYYAVIDIGGEYVKDHEFYKLPVKFTVNKELKKLNLDGKELFVIENEKDITSSLFKLYLNKTKEEDLIVKSNCLKYIFTTEAKTLLESFDNYITESIVFKPFNQDRKW